MPQPADELAAGRCVVVLHVSWSIYAIRAVVDAQSQEAFLANRRAALVILDEDDASVRQWLVELGVRDFVDYAVGAGSALWLSDGQLQRFEPSASNPATIASIADAIWINTAQLHLASAA